MVRDEAGKKGEGYMMEAFPELYSSFIACQRSVPVSERDIIQFPKNVWPKASLSDKHHKDGEQRKRQEAARTGWKILCRSGGKE